MTLRIEHDADYDDVEEILRQFDMNMAYGPCLGLSRVERWERAHRIGLDPPQNVKNMLQLAGGNPDCLWEGRV
jgi:DNA polymerase delta subunit 4